MKPTLSLLTLLLLAACSTPKGRNATADSIHTAMDAAVEERGKANKSNAVNDALLPPLSSSLPVMNTKPVETKFDLRSLDLKNQVGDNFFLHTYI